MAVEGMTPAQVAAFDQERQSIREVFSQVVENIRGAYYAPGSPGVGMPPDEVFVSIIQQLARVERNKVLALLTEAVMRLAAEGVSDEL